MLNIAELLSVLNEQFSQTTLQHFAFIIESILGLPNSVTTTSVAWYSPLSYRTVQRFYALKEVNWLLVNLLLVKSFVYRSGKHYLLAADETVKITKHLLNVVVMVDVHKMTHKQSRTVLFTNDRHGKNNIDPISHLSLFIVLKIS